MHAEPYADEEADLDTLDLRLEYAQAVLTQVQQQPTVSSTSQSVQHCHFNLGDLLKCSGTYLMSVTQLLISHLDMHLDLPRILR